MNMQDYYKKLENYYDAEGKLLQYPSKRPMRIIALTKIGSCFEEGKKYTEKEVNEIIKSKIAFSDVELIRREMFQYRMIGRLKDGSQYWAEPGRRETYKEYLAEVSDAGLEET